MADYLRLKDLECLPEATDKLVKAMFERILFLEHRLDIAQMRIYDLEDKIPQTPSLNTACTIIWEELVTETFLETELIVSIGYRYHLTRRQTENALDALHKNGLIIRDGVKHEFRWRKPQITNEGE